MYIPGINSIAGSNKKNRKNAETSEATLSVAIKKVNPKFPKVNLIVLANIVLVVSVNLL